MSLCRANDGCIDSTPCLETCSLRWHPQSYIDMLNQPRARRLPNRTAKFDNTQSTTLYRCFDADDVLLYVGISIHPTKRLQQHHRDSAWWHQVAKVTFVHGQPRPAALAAEAEAIRTEHPRFNITGVAA